MKGITDLDKIGGLSPKPKAANTTLADGDLFKKTFEKALGESDKSGQSSQTTSVTPLGEIQSVGFRVMNTDPVTLESGTETLLNKLDAYMEALKDPSQTLKDIEPLLLDIKQKADQLGESVAIAGEDQKDLASLAEQSSLLAQVEYQKFVRGDYV